MQKPTKTEVSSAWMMPWMQVTIKTAKSISLVRKPVPVTMMFVVTMVKL